MKHVAKNALQGSVAMTLKDGGEDDPASIVTKALGEFSTQFEKKFDDRLKAIEGKAVVVDPKLIERLDKIEAKTNRPDAGDDKKDKKEADPLETKAYDTYIRRGKEALTAEEIKSLRVSDDTAGGFLAPDAFHAELDRNVVLWSPVRKIARVMPTGSPAVLWPKRTGGMTGAWVGETQARPETTVTFGQNRYGVCELSAYVDVSNALLEDSVFDIGQLLAFEFAEEFGYLEGTAFVNGASQLSPSGFMQDSGVAYTPGTDANLVKGDGLIDLYHAIKAPYRINGTWGMNSTTLGTIRKLKDTNGNYMVAMAGLNNTPVTTLLGRPIEEMPDMPDIGAGAFPIVFGDFTQGYRVFDRISLSILRDPYSQATNGMTRFHGRRRVAGGVGKAEAIRKLKIATS